MTERQVDLLLTDQPLVVYNHDKKDAKNGKKEPVVSSDVDVIEAIARFKTKHGNDGDGSVSVDMSGFLLKDA